jgi:hypothetical protein
VPSLFRRISTNAILRNVNKVSPYVQSFKVIENTQKTKLEKVEKIRSIDEP